MVAAVYEALGKRYFEEPAGGDGVCSAEVVLRAADPQAHLQLELWGAPKREVRANSAQPRLHPRGRREDADAKTMGRWGVALGGDVIKQIRHQDGDDGR